MEGVGARVLTPTLESFRSRGVTVEGMVCDVSVPDQVHAVVDASAQLFGGTSG